MTEPNEGFIPERKVINERVLGKCLECGHDELLWLERILIEGSLEMYHLMHTEVEDVYQCEKCKNSWREFRYL
ncbi:MAG: hypothetical protein Q7W45_13505 [Bacteroidota bacterium]|nr:hypothetical protein [Bacteroidota bacterium]MDP3144463.1 hypothetical protein [Bacteroidota bacterium]MDP3555859.1 hypothetical protein [Bacteroidota bacterium]